MIVQNKNKRITGIYNSFFMLSLLRKAGVDSALNTFISAMKHGVTYLAYLLQWVCEEPK